MSKTGAMVITFLDQGRDESQEILKNFTESPGGVEYIKRSEDSYFSFVSDRLKDDEQYGSTFVTRSWLENTVNTLGLRIQFLDNELVNSQDAAIISHL